MRSKLLKVASSLFFHVQTAGEKIIVGDPISDLENFLIQDDHDPEDTFDLFEFDPLSDTDRGNAQLLTIIFATYKKLYEGGPYDLLAKKVEMNGALVENSREEIIRIAAEVLK